MITEFFRNCAGLSLQISPQTPDEKALLNEFINDNDLRFGTRGKLRIDFVKKKSSCEVQRIILRRKTAINGILLISSGWRQIENQNENSKQYIFYKNFPSGEIYLLGSGKFRVVKNRHINWYDGHRASEDGGDTEFSVKGFPVVGTLEDLKILKLA